jgi:RHH-type proline utilization regulon transcriptional repressor/proline dehydrogenase/delta 1-pyrroline-5-carboxylate dehydrogenase
VLCHGVSAKGLKAQHAACTLTGNRMLLVETPAAREFVNSLSASQRPSVEMVSEQALDAAVFQAAMFEGDSDALRQFNQQLAKRTGPIVLVQGLTTEEIEAGVGYRPERLLREISVSVNTAAAGGNASLMMIG